MTLDVLHADDGGNVFIWSAVTAVPVHVLHGSSSSITSISFGASDLWMAVAAAESVTFLWRERPIGQDILALWLDHSRSVDNCDQVTRELLAIYPTLVNQKVQGITCNASAVCESCFWLTILDLLLMLLQDKDGLSLLAYASGVSSERANKLLDVLLDACPRHGAGLVCCTSTKLGNQQNAGVPGARQGVALSTRILVGMHFQSHSAQVPDCWIQKAPPV